MPVLLSISLTYSLPSRGRKFSFEFSAEVAAMVQYAEVNTFSMRSASYFQSSSSFWIIQSESIQRNCTPSSRVMVTASWNNFGSFSNSIALRWAAIVSFLVQSGMTPPQQWDRAMYFPSSSLVTWRSNLSGFSESPTSRTLVGNLVSLAESCPWSLWLSLQSRSHSRSKEKRVPVSASSKSGSPTSTPMLAASESNHS